MDSATQEARFAEVTRQHMGIFLKTAYAFASPADRDDLVQEMLLAVWQALPAYDEQRCKLSTFIYRVANNRAQNWNRSRVRYGRRLEALERCPQLVLGSEQTEADTRRLEWLYALIRELPPLERTLLMLHLDGLSHREVGEVTGLSENNVGVRLHRIKQWLANRKGTDDGL